MSDAIQNVLKPISEASGLANAHYISPDMFAREREEIFFKSWEPLHLKAMFNRLAMPFP